MLGVSYWIFETEAFELYRNTQTCQFLTPPQNIFFDIYKICRARIQHKEREKGKRMHGTEKYF